MGFYDDKPDLFDTDVKGGFYGKAGASPKDEERPKLSFAWWEYLIIAVEVGLVTYTILVIANVVPLF
ncbi:MAG: hypothetical protein ACMXYM_00795 [Candidatus Woesearchaeota archaeon]